MNTTDSDTRWFRPADYVKITIFGFALGALANGLHAIILPLRVLDFVAESDKNTYLGLLTFAGLIVAMLVQPIAGAISDRSGFVWGRRRPYILLGTLATLLCLFGTGIAGSYIAIFVIWCLLQASYNTAQGPYQAFIPDLVPESKRGLASGVKVLLEIAGGIALLRVVGYLMGNYLPGEGGQWLWLSLGSLAIVLLGAMMATILTVRERPGGGVFKRPSLKIIYQSFRIDVKVSPYFTYFLISRLLFVMALTTIQTFALYFLKDVVGVANPAVVTADLLIVVGACMLAVAYPAGRLSDRLGRRPILISSGLLGAVGIALLFFSHSYSAVMLCGGLLGISAGAFMSTNWALATDLVSKDEAARYLGLTNLATAGGAALARLIGPAVDYFNALSPGMGYSVLLLACLLYFLVGSALLMKIKTTS